MFIYRFTLPPILILANLKDDNSFVLDKNSDQKYTDGIEALLCIQTLIIREKLQRMSLIYSLTFMYLEFV